MKNLAIMSASFIALAASASANAQDFKAKLIGYQEVPAVSTVASGEFHATW